MKVSRYYLPAVAWTVIMLVLTLLPSPDFPHTFLSSIPYFDKMVHAGIFGLFVILWYGGAYKTTVKSGKEGAAHPMTLLARVILAAILLGLAIEIVQKEWRTIQRDFEWFDWLADTLGAFLGAAIAAEIFRTRGTGKDA